MVNSNYTNLEEHIYRRALDEACEHLAKQFSKTVSLKEHSKQAKLEVLDKVLEHITDTDSKSEIIEDIELIRKELE